jgi:hypothetical protein
MTKLIVFFRTFSNAPKNVYSESASNFVCRILGLNFKKKLKHLLELQYCQSSEKKLIIQKL